MTIHTQFLAMHTNLEDGIQSFVTMNKKGYFVGMSDLHTGEVLPFGKIYAVDKFDFEFVNNVAKNAIN